MRLSLAPYLLGLLREQKNSSCVFVLLGMTVCSWAVEKGRGLILKGDVLKWPCICICVRCEFVGSSRESTVLCSFLGMKVRAE